MPNEGSLTGIQAVPLFVQQSEPHIDEMCEVDYDENSILEDP
jgi:hypothetical protein